MQHSDDQGERRDARASPADAAMQATTTTAATAEEAPAPCATAAATADGVGSAPSEQLALHDDRTDAAEHAAEASNATTEPPSLQQQQQQPTTSIVVRVKFIHREQLSLQCSPEILISSLKQQVLEVYSRYVASGESVEVDEQHGPLRLIYKGKVLRDDQTLASYGFASDDTLHAVFGRPQASPTAAASSAPSTTAAPLADAAAPNMLDNGTRIQSIIVDSDGSAPTPEIVNILSSMFSAISGVPVTRTGAAYAPAPAPAPATTTTPPLAPVTTASTTFTNASPSNDLPTRAAPSVPRTRVPAARAPSAASLLNHAASLRRLMPALELSPLSQPPALSDEMYALGNALRETGDTFLALHRQLQFVATRFLTEHNLSEPERRRLRTRVHQLVPVLDQVAVMTHNAASNLAASSYGPGTASAQASTSAAPVQPSTMPAAAPSPPRTPVTSSAALPVVPGSVSIAPTVNVFSGSSNGAATATSIGNSIADVLQAVNGLRMGAATPHAPSPSAASSASDGLGSILNLVSAIASGGRVGTTGVAPTAPPTRASGTAASSQQPPPPPSPTFTTSVAQGAAAEPAAGADEYVGPLSAMFTHVMRDMDTLDEWDPETADALLQRVVPHLRHRMQMLLASDWMKTRWRDDAVDEIERALRRELESHDLSYTSDPLQRAIHRAMLEQLLQLLVPSPGANGQQQRTDELVAALWKLLRRFVSSLHFDIAEQTSAIEAVRVVANVVSGLLVTEDLSVRRSAGAFASRVHREVVSFLKTHIA